MYILNLPDWKILDSKDSENDYLIIAEYTQLPFHCLKCSFFAGLKKHGKKPVVFLDLPAHGKRVGIEVQRQRYKCDPVFFASRFNSAWTIPLAHEAATI